jgi:hypothetical protein
MNSKKKTVDIFQGQLEEIQEKIEQMPDDKKLSDDDFKLFNLYGQLKASLPDMYEEEINGLLERRHYSKKNFHGQQEQLKAMIQE